MGLIGYLGRAANGNLMPQWPAADGSQARKALAGQSVGGLIGPPGQVQGLLAALGLSECKALKSEVEPGFSLRLPALCLPALRLPALRLPDCVGLTPRPARESDRDLATDRRSAYNQELTTVDAARARQIAQDDVARMLAKASHWLLMRGDQPVAMAGINASIPGAGRVGGVYTPTALRRQGFARRAVGLMLDHLRTKGTHLALLFAASDIAARTYLAIGFQPSHSFALHLLAEPAQLPCP